MCDVGKKGRRGEGKKGWREKTREEEGKIKKKERKREREGREKGCCVITIMKLQNINLLVINKLTIYTMVKIYCNERNGEDLQDVKFI